MTQTAQAPPAAKAAPEGTTPPAARRRLCGKELPAALVLLAAAAAVLLWQARAKGSHAQLRFASGAAYTVPLWRDAVLQYDDGALPVTLQVEDGRVRFIRSVCPDHLCESFGWLEAPGQTAVCAPAGAVLQVEGG